MLINGTKWVSLRHNKQCIMSNKNWAFVPSTNEIYQVSDCGQVRRVPGKIKNNQNGGVRKVGGKVLSQKTKKNGYKEVALYASPQKCTMAYVHRLVAMAFIGDIPPCGEVNHIDGNKSNNHVSNLEILTSSQNRTHSLKVLGNKAPVKYGSDHGMARLNESQVLEIRNHYANGKTPTELSLMYRTPFSTICKICYRNTWKHI